MDSYRFEVGKSHGARAGSILGAIANETGLESQNIGRIKIFNAHSTVELPVGLSKDIINILRKVWVAEQQLNISKIEKKVTKRATKTKPIGQSKKNKNKKFSTKKMN